MTIMPGIEQEITLEDLVVGDYEESEDPELLTHIVNPPANLHLWLPGMSAQEIVDLARLTNTWVEALCGKRWIPKHNPDKHDICQTCMEIADRIIREMG